MSQIQYAMLFPGQGSQAVGMLSGHADPIVRATFDEASQALGWDLTALVADGPLESLNQTARTQPALLAAGIAVWRLWQARELPPPVALAGHSLGEYTALVAAGALAFDDALKLVELRGQLMQSAVPEGVGGMAAVVGLDDAAVEAFCGDYPGDGVLEPANYNAPGQVVIAGNVPALEWLEGEGKARGARMIVRLPMSVPSHCSLLRGAADRLAERLAQTAIHKPAIGIRHNLDGRPRGDADGIRRALHEQLFRPVRWSATVTQLREEGVTTFFECGPGKVLVGLNKRIAKDLTSIALEDGDGMGKAQVAVKA
ncbi:ACP S-malonyltransferase [Solimonas terrae]|uniref:Malonyl CoA-acyl carrier protein transacylase n=1 Tax=Solimonas terrae TaxID=1396819 RepID=A0A6M2BV94_9GAMM|nr:ACP S-malonyltransferase [Solimonas terrae]NGY06314.1 ACP S-malonyltransferase [Solimonas terrae]